MNKQKITLDWRSQYGFCLGHVLNDLASPIWFSYSLLFYKMFYPAKAYWFVVTGQVFDSVATLFIGMYFDSDITKSKLFRLGHYTTWYVLERGI